jgi:queuosine biosynthesis protein QueC
MAENESLDLGSSGAQRWSLPLTAFQNGEPCEQIAPKYSKSLIGGLRKALKQFQERGVTLATRSAHPKFLRLMSRLASLVADEVVEFRLPFFDRTKGEVVRSMVEAGLEELARKTASCVHYPLRHSRQKQCGVCPACVFRRQAMTVAGIVEPAEAYKYDFLTSPDKASRIPSKRLLYLKAFLMQAASLRYVWDGASLPRPVARHVLNTEVLPEGHPPEELATLLARYRDEWLTIARDRNQKGFPWARLLAVPQLSTQGAAHASA